jgi:hypothetical protein
MKGLGISLVLGMMVIFVLLLGFWLHTPYAISAQWEHPEDHGLEPEDLMQSRGAR